MTLIRLMNPIQKLLVKQGYIYIFIYIFTYFHLLVEIRESIEITVLFANKLNFSKFSECSRSFSC